MYLIVTLLPVLLTSACQHPTTGHMGTLSLYQAPIPIPRTTWTLISDKSWINLILNRITNESFEIDRDVRKHLPDSCTMHR